VVLSREAEARAAVRVGDGRRGPAAIGVVQRAAVAHGASAEEARLGACVVLEGADGARLARAVALEEPPVADARGRAAGGHVPRRVGVGLGAARRADTAPRLPSPRTSPRRTPSWVVACGSGISDCLANRVLVKAKRACSTPRESLAANLLLCTDERIVIVRLFVSQDPQETKKLGMNLTSH